MFGFVSFWSEEVKLGHRRPVTSESVNLVPVSASQIEDSELEVRRCLILPTSASRPGGCGKASTADANEEAVGAVWLLAPSLFIYVFY